MPVRDSMGYLLGGCDAVATDSPVNAGDLTRFAETFADLADSDVMSQAWQ